MEGKQKRIIVILMVLTIIFTISGGTLAYWTWTTNESQKTAVTFTATQDFSCAADGGGSITSGDAFIAPTNCSWDPFEYGENPNPHMITREITVTPTILRDGLTISMDLWLNINQIGTGLSNSQNFRWELTNPNYDTPYDVVCGNDVVASGTFYGKSVGDKVMLLDQKEYSSSEPQTYYLHIWLDAAETSASTMNQSFSFSLGGECTDENFPKAYAVFSEDDNSLRFYKATEKITEGSTYNGRTVTEVYTDFENNTFEEPSLLPWGHLGTAAYNIIVEDEISPVSTAHWFSVFEELHSIDLTNLDTSNVTDMTGMFKYMRFVDGNMNIVGLSDFDTSKVTNMEGMFSELNYGGDANPALILDLSNWDVSNVTDMSYMFNGAGDWIISLSLNLSGWDVSNVTNMEGMFGETGSYTTTFDINLSNWNTLNVTNMSNMFWNTGHEAMNSWSLDLSGWNVDKVTNYEYFYNEEETRITPPVWVN